MPEMAYDLDDGMKLKPYDPKRSGRMIRLIVPYWYMFKEWAEHGQLKSLNYELREYMAALKSPSEEDAIDQARQEIEGMVKDGANVDTRHERDYLLTYISQKYGVAPEKLAKYIKIIPKRPPNLDDTIKKSWGMTLGRMPHEIAKVVGKIELRIEDESSEDPNLDGETFPETGRAEGFVVYRNGELVKKGRVSDIMQLMAHEMWHVFAEHTDFYTRLEDVLTGKINHWLGYGIKDVERFVTFLDMLEHGGVAGDFMRRLRQKIVARRWWGEAYILEQAEADFMRGILKQVRQPHFLGAIDELMAEALGRIVTGKSLFVPRTMINFILDV